MFHSHAYISARIAVSATPSASEETVRDPEMAGCSFRTCNTREREREREREEAASESQRSDGGHDFILPSNGICLRNVQDEERREKVKE